MSAPAQIDYDALASQHGGTAAVDYDALAAQHGGAAAGSVPYSNRSATTPEEEPSFWDSLKREGKSTVGAIAGIPSAIYHAFSEPPTDSEQKEFDTSKQPPAIKQAAIGISRLTAAPIADAAVWYTRAAQGKIPNAYEQALSAAPEAFGQGAGTVIAGKLTSDAPGAAKAAIEKAPAVLQSLGDTTSGAVRATARGVNTALAKAPGTVGATVGGAVGVAAGHATGLPGAGELGGGLGSAVGAQVGKEVLPNVRIPGEGFGLPNRVTGGPVSAPPYVAPVEPEPVYPGGAQPQAPSPELLQGNALREGAKPAVDQSKGLGELPLPAVMQAIKELGPSAPIPSLTARANQIANLAVEGAGGTIPKPLEPNVPLKNQGNGSALKPAADIPEGHTPVTSSALKSWKYDPETREFESMTQGGQIYVHGDISPEQAAVFEAAPSKGKAWQAIRQNGTLVAKVVNGKRIPVKPVVSDEDLISPEEWEHGHALGTEVEGSPK